MLLDALEPGRTRLFVPVFDGTSSMGNLIGCHSGIAYEDHFVVLRVLVENIPGIGSLIHAPDVVLPQTLIHKVVKVEVLHVLELGARGRKQLLAHPHVGVHRTAHIEKDEHFNRVMALGHHLQVEITRITSCRPNSVVKIQLVCGTLACELAQPPKRYLDVADAQGNAVVQILELALFPNLNGPSMAAFFLADAVPLSLIHISAPTRRTPISYAVFCLKKK